MKEKVRETVLGLIKQKKNMQGIGEDDNFFDLGVSSLTIIELQIAIEEALDVTIPTSQLMRMNTIRSWVEAYAAAYEKKFRERTASKETAALVGEPQ